MLYTHDGIQQQWRWKTNFEDKIYINWIMTLRKSLI